MCEQTGLVVAAQRMSFLPVTTAIWTLLALLFNAASAEPPKRDGRVDPAAASSPLPLPDIDAAYADDRVLFDQRPTKVGDRVSQSVSIQLDLATRIVQSGQTAHEGETTMARQQQREVEVLETADGRLKKARVHFKASRVKSPEGDSDALTSQPIEGKQYLAERSDDQLLVTDVSGDIPPMEEFELVVESLHSLGKPNPLARVLVGRHVAVGERLLVPLEIAEELLGLTPQMGEVRRFELSLERVTPASGASSTPVAEFLARIETVGRHASQMTMTIAGLVKIEVATCRTLAADLSGPVNMSAVERSSLGIYQYNAHGVVRLAVESKYSAPAAK